MTNMQIYVYNHRCQQTCIDTPIYVVILKPNRLQGKQVDVCQTCEKYIFSRCWCICKQEMTIIRSGTKMAITAGQLPGGTTVSDIGYRTASPQRLKQHNDVFCKDHRKHPNTLANTAV